MDFENNEIRLQNRPDDIPLERSKCSWNIRMMRVSKYAFKSCLRNIVKDFLFNFLQKKARTNSKNRKSYTETHTFGPKRIAQLRHKMVCGKLI